MLRFVSKLKKATLPSSTSITVNEIKAAELECIKSCQQTVYNKEIQSLHEKKVDNAIQRQLRLFLDEQGIHIRCRSTLHNAPITYDAKFPILLPANHNFTQLIMLNSHKKNMPRWTASYCYIHQTKILDHTDTPACKKYASQMCDMQENTREALSCSS